MVCSPYNNAALFPYNLPTAGINGFTCSTFDLLHAGHIMMLAEVRQQCDFLLVGLHTDPSIERPDTKNAPIQSLQERFIQLSAVKFVDAILTYDTEEDLHSILTTVNIHRRFVGEEYKNKNLSGQALCIWRKIEIVYNTRRHTYSTTELRNRVYVAESNNIRKNTK